MTDPRTNSVTIATGRSGWRMPLGRRGWLVLAAAALGAGGALNWGWLTAIGLAPILIAVAPCAVMCGLGLCMAGGDKTCAPKGSGPDEKAGPGTDGT